MTNFKYVLFFAFLFSVQGLWSQKKYVSIPTAFKTPDYIDNIEQYKFYMESDDFDKEKELPWLVFTEREGVKFFDSPDASLIAVGAKGTLPLDNTSYIVIDENKGWIKIGKAKAGKRALDGKKINYDNFETLGWVDKEKMLLWTNALTDSNTGIEAKGFILNKLKSFELDKLEKAAVYKSPDSRTPSGYIELYDFYYIYDVYYNDSGELDRFLLGRDANFIRSNKSDKIVGWVDVSKVTQWNTRLALEPNFNKVAFEERKANMELQMVGFKGRNYARNFNQGDRSSKIMSNILWKKDSANPSMSHKLGKSDPYRYTGYANRFPCLEYFKQDGYLENGNHFFKSGVIAEMSGEGSEDTKQTVDKLKQSISSKSKLNVLIVLERSEFVGQYKDVIQAISSDLFNSSNVNLSLAYYSDFLEENEKDQFDILKLTNNKAVFDKFLNGIDWNPKTDQDPYTILNYGLTKAVLNTGFKELETNYVIHLGTSADFMQNRRRAFKMKKDESLKKYNFDSKVLRDKAVQYKINFVHALLDNSNGLVNTDFEEDIWNSMNDVSKAQYTDAKLRLFENVPVPAMPDREATANILSIGDFLMQYMLLRPKESTHLDKNFLKEQIDLLLTKHLESLNDIEESLVKLEKGDLKVDFSVGSFEEESAIPIIVEVARLTGAKTQQDVLKFLDQVKKSDAEFYHEVYFPANNYKGAQYSSFSYVLLYPLNDLERYISRMEEMIRVYEQGDKRDKRLSLQAYFTNLVEEFTGESNIAKKGEFTLEDIAKLLQGVKGEGYDIFRDSNLKFKLKDIDNDKKFTDDQFFEFINRLESKYSRLREIHQLSKKNEYEYGFNNNQYLWIPVEEVF
jgi:hypothetical protein